MTKLDDLRTDESEREKIINFCTDLAFRVVSIKDSIMNFYISNGKEREVNYQEDLSSKSAKSRDTSKSSSDRKSKSKSNITVHSRTSVHSQLSARTHSSSLQGKSNESYFAVLERQKTAEHAKQAGQVEESAKRKLKILEKSLDFEKEKIENETFEAGSKAIIAEYESKLDERNQFSNDNSSVVSKLSSGHRLLAENTLQNENKDNHTSLISESYITPSNVYNKTRENILINSGENKKLKVTEALNPKTRETNILMDKPNSQSFRDFKHFKHENLQPENLNPLNKNLLSPSNSTKKDNKTTLIKPPKHINATSKQSAINQQDQTVPNSS